ncbi:MAG TPA: FecR domain-containing protein, partial [Flavobacteriaceae bacterium]|nr:FecR domain-containing protein [Flavobacteriaceae bacterium]
VIGFGSYFAFFNPTETQVESLVGTTENIVLPDGSSVVLNAVSSLRYDPENWEQNREVHLTGEAFFHVAKGEQFNVVTDAGTISVLGTQFNVKQRPGYFEVSCYEGLVSVKTSKDSLLLPAGKSVRIVNGTAQKNTTKRPSPSWTKGISSFQSVPFSQVIAELERQYQLEIHLKTRTFDVDQLFTGSFAHNNLETALKSVTVPFNLVYQLKNDAVILKVRD